MPETVFSPSYTPEEMASFLEALRQYGTEVYACHASGIPLAVIRTLRRLRSEFDIECEEALELHSGLLYAESVKRATVGKSDLLLGRLLEAKVQGFSKEARAAEVKRIGMPRELRLRSFEADADGNVVEVGDEAAKVRETGSAAAVSASREVAPFRRGPGAQNAGAAQDAVDDLAAPVQRGAARGKPDLQQGAGGPARPDPGHVSNLGLWNGI